MANYEWKIVDETSISTNNIYLSGTKGEMLNNSTVVTTTKLELIKLSPIPTPVENPTIDNLVITILTSYDSDRGYGIPKLISKELEGRYLILKINWEFESKLDNNPILNDDGSINRDLSKIIESKTQLLIEARFDGSYEGITYSNTLDCGSFDMTEYQQLSELLTEGSPPEGTDLTVPEVHTPYPPTEALIDPLTGRFSDDGLESLRKYKEDVNNELSTNTNLAKYSGKVSDAQYFIDVICNYFNIKLPKWVIYNIVALQQDWYLLEESAITQYQDCTIDFVKNSILNNSKSAAFEGLKIILINQYNENIRILDANYNNARKSGRVSDYTIELENYVKIKNLIYDRKNIDILEVEELTRVIEGDINNPILESAKRNMKRLLLDILTTDLKRLLITSEMPNGSLLGYSFSEITKWVLESVRDSSFKKKYPIVFECPEEPYKDKNKARFHDYNPYLFMYVDTGFYRQLVNTTIQILKEIEVNDNIRSIIESGITYDNHKKLRSLECYYWRLKDISKGMTPFTLDKSEIFMNEYLTSIKGLEVLQRVLQVVSECEAAIRRIPEDIAQIINCVIEPSGAIVVTPAGPGSVTMNALQVLGTIQRVQSNLEQLFWDLQKPISSAAQLGLSIKFLDPIKTLITNIKQFIPTLPEIPFYN